MKENKIYKLVADVREPIAGPPMEIGWTVKIVNVLGADVLVQSLEHHEDVGNGADDHVTMEHSFAWVSLADLEEITLDEV